MPGKARAALVAACVLWAVSFVATKVALESLPPLTLVTLRLLVSAACFLPWILTSGGLSAVGGRSGLVRLSWLSLLGTGLHYGLQTVGLQYTTASNASLYAVTAPITILLFSAAMLGERITLPKAVGVGLAVAGMLLVLGPETLLSLELGGHVAGDLLVLVSIVMWGLFTVFGKAITDELGALLVTAWVTVIGSGWMLPFAGYEMIATGGSLAEVGARAWAALAFLGVGCSFLATLLYFIALERTESQKVGVYLYTIPPMTAAVAVVYLGETLSASLVVGSVLVIGGVALTERG